MIRPTLLAVLATMLLVAGARAGTDPNDAIPLVFADDPRLMEKQPYRFKVEAKAWGDSTNVQFHITVTRKDRAHVLGQALLVLKSGQCPVAQVPGDSVVGYEFIVSRSFLRNGDFSFRANRQPGVPPRTMLGDVSYHILLERHWLPSK